MSAHEPTHNSGHVGARSVGTSADFGTVWSMRTTRPSTGDTGTATDSTGTGATSARADRRDTTARAADLAADRGLYAVAGDAPTERAWSDEDVCAYLGITARKLGELVGAPGFPEPRRLGGRRQGRRWAPDAIANWIADPERRRLEREGRLGAKGTAARI